MVLTRDIIHTENVAHATSAGSAGIELSLGIASTVEKRLEIVRIL